MIKTPEEIRLDFPILHSTVNGKPLIYLDNAATMQVPRPVWAVMEEQYRRYHANIHRGIHFLSEQSTARVEHARHSVREFIGAQEAEEVIFTGGTTQSINLVAAGYREVLNPGDEVLVSAMEHHSNLCPWQIACRRSGATLKSIPVDENGELLMGAFRELLSERTKLVAVTCCSNVLGTVNPVQEIIRIAHEKGAAVLLDAAQFMRHAKVDVQELDCDFLCFSGHKISGPTGTGVLYGKRRLLEVLPLVQFGGGMVDSVTLGNSTFVDLPFRLEAGTQNITGIIGLGAAVGYLTEMGISAIASYEKELLNYAEARLGALDHLNILGAPAERAGVLSFNLDGFHCYDTAKLLDQLGIAVRSGQHCAQPLLSRFGLSGAVRVSPAYYNKKEEIDALVAGLERILSLKGRQ